MAAPVYQMNFEQDIAFPITIRHGGMILFTGDNLADTVSVSILENGAAHAISGTVTMNCIRADGATVAVTGSVSGNTASATLTQACVAIPGPLAVVMKITSDSTTTTLLKVIYTVDIGVTGTAVDPGTIIPDINALISAVETAIGNIPADYSDLLAAIAPSFNPEASTPYLAGSYVWYPGLSNNPGALYKFTADHSGSWTGSDVEVVVFGNVITDLNSAITQADLPQMKADLRMKAPAIVAETELKNSFSAAEINSWTDGYTITCDASDYTSVAVADGEGIIPISDQIVDSSDYIIKTVGNMIETKAATRTTGSYFFLRWGSGSVNTRANLKQKVLDGNKLYFCVYVDGTLPQESGTTGSTIQFEFGIRDANDNTIGAATRYFRAPISGFKTTAYTVSGADAEKININVYFGAGEYTSAKVYFSASIKPYSEMTAGDILTFDSVGSDGFDIFPPKAKATYIVDTKKYVDDAVPEGMLTKEDLIYLSPEMYGAKGDGTTDDAVALAACMNASKVSDSVSIPVRGFGRYATSQPIVMTGRYANVYLHEVIYTGADAAVKIRGFGCKYSIDKIQAISENAAVGLRVDASTEIGLTSCDIRVGYIYSKSHTVELVNVSPYAIMYNTFHFDYQKSALGDIFHGNQTYYTNENEVYGRTVDAQNGHFYNLESGTYSISEWRFHNYCIEQHVKYGIKGCARLTQCRTGEFTNHIGEDGDAKRGVLFDFDGTISTASGGGAYTDDETQIVINTVDVSGAKSFEDTLEEVAQWLEDNPDAETFWQTYKLVWHPSTFKKVDRKSNWGDINLLPKFSMLVQYDKKIIRIEEGEWYEKISNAETRLSLSFPTFFDIDTAQAEIYLSYSYCCFGINKFIVKQYSDKKAIIYDKFGNVLFDGTNKDAGTYQFECALKKYTNYVVDLPGGGTHTIDTWSSPSIYDFTNEVWHIYKLNEV